MVIRLGFVSAAVAYSLISIFNWGGLWNKIFILLTIYTVILGLFFAARIYYIIFYELSKWFVAMNGTLPLLNRTLASITAFLLFAGISGLATAIANEVAAFKDIEVSPVMSEN